MIGRRVLTHVLVQVPERHHIRIGRIQLDAMIGHWPTRLLFGQQPPPPPRPGNINGPQH
jgi:hypothetical protein